MQRIIVNRSATITHTFLSDGDPTNPSPDEAVVTITRDDGTAIVTSAETVDEGEGVVSYTLPPGDVPLLDLLRFDWQAVFGDEVQTFTDYVEVCGAHLFTIAQARAIKPLDDTTKYSTQAIIDARTLAETALEDACKVAFVPRYFRERCDGRGRTDLLLSRSRPLEIYTATVDGSSIDVADLELYDVGTIYHEEGWPAGRRNITLTGAHGYPMAPPRVSRAALLLAKRFLVDSPVSDRATSMTTEDGTTQFLVTAGVRQAVFDIPEANQIVQEYGVKSGYAVA